MKAPLAGEKSPSQAGAETVLRPNEDLNVEIYGEGDRGFAEHIEQS